MSKQHTFHGKRYFLLGLFVVVILFLTYFVPVLVIDGAFHIYPMKGFRIVMKEVPLGKLFLDTVFSYGLWFTSTLSIVTWCIGHGLFAFASFKWIRTGDPAAAVFMFAFGIVASSFGMMWASMNNCQYQQKYKKVSIGLEAPNTSIPFRKSSFRILA